MRYGEGYEQHTGGFRLPYLTSWVKILLIQVAVMFFVQLILGEAGRFWLYDHFAFNPSKIWSEPYYFFQLFTYLLIPRLGPVSFVFNLLSIYFIGGFLEGSLGPRRFIRLYFFSGVAAALLYLIFSWGGPGQYFGLSPAILGLLACAAVLYPRMQIIFFIFPMPMWVLAAILTFVQLYFVLAGGGTQWVSLLGLACGALFAYSLKLDAPFWDRFSLKSFFQKMESNKKENERKRDAILRKEMDRILEKINRHGIGSLSSQEKKTLDEASRRFRNQAR